VSSQPSRQVNDRLRVREESDAYFVVLEHDESDWIVKFSKAGRLAESYNDRFDDPRMDAVKRSAPPPGSAGFSL